MKALLLSKYKHLELADHPTPEPGLDDVHGYVTGQRLLVDEGISTGATRTTLPVFPGSTRGSQS